MHRIEIGEGRFTANYYHQSNFWLADSAYQAPNGRTPGYGLVNARVELNHIAGSKVSAALFATNLLNLEASVRSRAHRRRRRSGPRPH